MSQDPHVTVTPTNWNETVKPDDVEAEGVEHWEDNPAGMLDVENNRILHYTMLARTPDGDSIALVDGGLAPDREKLARKIRQETDHAMWQVTFVWNSW